MSRYGEPTDEHMREVILRELSRRRLELMERVDHLDGRAREETFDERRIDYVARAASHRRQAAHYQQAIELLTAAPMPPVESVR